MKKMLALLLAAVMALAGVSAAAEEPAAPAQGVYLKVTVDSEAAKNLLPAFGVPEEQTAQIDPILAVVNALGIELISDTAGIQADLDLNGTKIISLGGAVDEKGITVAGSLFPNHLLTLSWDTLTEMMKQYMPAATGEESAEGGEGTDFTAAFASLGEYVTEFSGTVAGATTPGEPETGSFEFDGLTFDTKTPQNVDVKAMAEAAKTLMEKMLKDPAMQGMLQNTPGFDPDEALKGFEEAMAEENLPDVTVDVYTNSDGSEQYYAVSEATYKGAEAPSYRYIQLYKGSGIGTFGFHAFDMGLIIGAEYAPDGFRADFTMGGEMQFALDVKTGGEALFSADVFIMDMEKPALNIRMTASEAPARSLSLDAEGKTVLPFENLMGENAGEAFQSLQEDFMNAWVPAVMQAMQAEPAVQTLFMQNQNPEQPETGTVDPNAWKTLGDVVALEGLEYEGGDDGDGRYRMMVSRGGQYFEVIAAASGEVLEEYQSLSFADDDYWTKKSELLKQFEIEQVTDLAPLAIPQEELDGWVGKTGQDMLDAGWEINGYRQIEGVFAVNMINDRFNYAVTFEGIDDSENYSEEAIPGATVTGVTFAGWSYKY